MEVPAVVVTEELRERSRVGRELVEGEEAVEGVYIKNCVEEEPSKFRCPLSGKLFKEVKYVRKHIENKHKHVIDDAKRAALEPKYEEAYLLGAEKAAAMPPVPPPPPRFPREALDDFGRRPRTSFGEGGKGGGRGKGFGGKGFGKGYGKGYDGMGPPMGRGGGAPPPPPDGAEVIRRPVVQYRDLDAPDDDDLFS